MMDVGSAKSMDVDSAESILMVLADVNLQDLGKPQNYRAWRTWVWQEEL